MNFLIQELNLENAQDVDFVISRHLDIQKLWNQKYTQSEMDKRSERDRLFKSKQESLNIIAINDNQIIAFHRLLAKNENGKKYCQVLSSWVTPDLRGLGIIRELKSIGIQWSKEKGAVFLQTRVHSFNERMLSINMKDGFQIVTSSEFIVMQRLL